MVQPAAEPRPVAQTMTDAEFEAIMARAMSMFDALGNAADAAGVDCGKLAAALTKVLDDHEDFLTRARTWKGDPAARQRSLAWFRAHMDDMMPPLIKVGQASYTCNSDARVVEAMQRLDDLK